MAQKVRTSRAHLSHHVIGFSAGLPVLSKISLSMLLAILAASMRPWPDETLCLKMVQQIGFGAISLLDSVPSSLAALPMPKSRR